MHYHYLQQRAGRRLHLYNLTTTAPRFRPDFVPPLVLITPVDGCTLRTCSSHAGRLSLLCHDLRPALAPWQAAAFDPNL